ncbi:hypothetical protein [Acidithiobacillus sp.]
MTENNLRPRNDRWILRVINTFFVLLILLFSSVVLTPASVKVVVASPIF